MSRRALMLVMLVLSLGPEAAWAELVKGRIEQVSRKAQTLQIGVKGRGRVIVRVGPQTRYEHAGGFADLAPPDLVEVEYEPGRPAARIRKIVFALPPGVEIDIQELIAVLQGRRGPYFLGDARPPKRYYAGHIPSAKPAFPGDRDAFLEALPADKARLLVFYCGGPTCPYTGRAVKLAMEHGYRNVKGFQAGMPEWKRVKLPVHISARWLAERLGPHHVVLDVRDPARAERGHVPTAVSMPSPRLAAMTQRFVEEDRVPVLPGVSDKGAPVTLYSDRHNTGDVLRAFKNVRDWGYKNATILEGGFERWKELGLPVETGALPTEIHYEKALPPGAIPRAEFERLAKSREGVVFLDVRSDREVAERGTLHGAVHIPLERLEEQLDRLPRDQEIIAYCANGIRAEMAYELLRRHGYQVRFLNETIGFDQEGNYHF